MASAGKLAVLAFALGTTVACTASAAAPVRVSLAGKLRPAVAGHAWAVKLAVRPVSFRGAVRVTATGAKRIDLRATGGHGSYRARLVFPVAGWWRLTARAGASTSRLGSVHVRKGPSTPLTFVWPTSIDAEPGGTLLLVENGLGRVVRVDPASGKVTPVASALAKPFAATRAPSGSIFVSSAHSLLRIDGTGALVTVATADDDIGPIAIAASGDVYYSTATRIFRLAGGAGPPLPVAGTGFQGGGGDGGPASNAQFSSPHGLAVAGDGALLVSDTRNDRIRRIDPSSGVITALAQVGAPDGIDIAADGTITVVDSSTSRVVRLSSSGARIGFVGPAFQVPYDVEEAADGVVYVLETSESAPVRRVARDGTVTTVSR